MQVFISKHCHCVIKNKLTNTIECKDKNEALEKANEIIEILEKETCKTHLFFIKEQSNKIIIDSKYNPDKTY